MKTDINYSCEGVVCHNCEFYNRNNYSPWGKCLLLKEEIGNDGNFNNIVYDFCSCEKFKLQLKKLII